MTKKTYTKLQRVLALALALVLCVTLLPVEGLSAFAKTTVGSAGALGIVETADDPSTATRPNDVFMDGTLGSTLNAGKILVGKSVNDGTEGGAATPVNLRSELFNMPQYATDANYGQFRPNEGNFLVTISQSSQMYGVSNNIPLPMDVVFVLDTSGSMAWAADSRNNRAQAVVDAANAAISTILGMNEHNRIAVVGFSDSASTMSELRHYEDTTGGYGAGNKAATEHLTWSNSNNRSGNIRGRNTSGEAANGRNGTNGGTNIQDGILMGAKILTNVAANDTYIMMDTDGDGNEERITRMPILVVLSDGAATYSEEDAEWWDANGNRQGPGGVAYAGNGFLAALTAAYYKNVITQKYYGDNAAESAAVYTIGVGLGSITNGTASVPNTNTSVDDVTLAHWTMDPSTWLGGSVTNSEIDDDFNGYWTSYTAAAAATQKREFSVEVNNNDYYDFCNQSGSETYTEMEWQRVNVGTYWNPRWEWQEVEVEKTRTWTDNIQESVTSLKYNDDYWAASSTEEISGAFKNLVSAIQKRAVTAPTLTDVNFGDNYSGFVTFTDPIGEYMEVKRVLGVTGGGYMYQGRHMGELAEGYNPNWENETTSEVQAAFNAAFEQAMMDRIRVSTAAGGALPTLAQVRSILDVVTRTETEGNVTYNAGGGNIRLFDWDTYGGQMYYNSDEEYGNSFVWFGKVHYPEGNTEEAANEPYDVQFIGVAPKYADSAEWLHTNDNAALLDSAKAAGANCVVRSYFMYGTADGVQTEGASDMLHFQVRVMTSLAEPHQQYVSIKVPASLLAMQTVLIDDTDPNNLVATYDDLIPSRVVYEIGLRSDIDANNVWSIVEEDYLTETLADGSLANVDDKGNILFFTNDWDRSATVESHTRSLAHANFDVADNNTFYRYEKDTLLLNAQGNAITSAPVAGQKYFYSRTYYTWTPEADGSSKATEKSALIEITWPGDVTAKVVDGKYYIPAGSYTAYTVTEGDDLTKTDNTTGTASVVTHPQRASGADDPSYTTWLGNNGRLTFKGLKPKSVTGTAADGSTGEIDGKAVKVGDVLTYTINTVNTTGETAEVVITDKIPAGTALVDGSISATVDGTAAVGVGAEANGVITWNINGVADGAIVTAEFKVTVLESAVAVGTVDNQATIKVGENEYTTNITTNPVTGKQATNVDDTPINVGGVKVGDAVEFHIAFINTTGETADIVVKDKIPAGTTFTGTTSHPGALNANWATTGELEWTFENVAPGARGVVSFVVQVNAGVPKVEIDNTEVLGIENTAAYTIQVDNAPTIDTNPVKVEVQSGRFTLDKIVELYPGADAATTAAAKSKEFAVTLTETTGMLNGTFDFIRSVADPAVDPIEGTVTFTDGVATVQFKHGDSLMISGLPIGVTIIVSEAVPAGYSATYQDSNSVSITSNSYGVDVVTVTNKYEAVPTDDISTMFSVKKTLTSPVILSGKSFTFTAQQVEVTGTDTAPVVGNAMGNPLVTSAAVGVDAAGTNSVTVKFSGKTFDTPGTYYYLVSEYQGSLEGITYDKTQYLVKILVTDNGAGKLIAATTVSTRTYDGASWSGFDADTELDFANSYKPDDVSLTLTGTKTLTGRNLIADEFTFVATEIKATELDGTTPITGRDIVRYGHLAADGTITFDPIFYSVPGIYEYEVKELNTTGQPFVEFDTTTKTVWVQVTSSEGVLSAAVLNTTEYPSNAIAFTNKYNIQDTVYTPEGTKTLTNRDMVSGESFTFTVYDEAGKPVTTGNVTGATKDVAKNIDFGSITYSKDSFTNAAVKSEIFTYTVKENIPTVGADAQITYDHSVYQFQVELTLDGSGVLKAEMVPSSLKRIANAKGVTVDEAVSAVAFTNLYSPPAELQIGTNPAITKTIESTTSTGTIPEGLTFGFTLYKAAVAMGPEGEIDDGYAIGDVVGTGISAPTTEGSGPKNADITFSTLNFYKPGTYYAWIVENNGGKTEHGVTHDGSRYLLKIEVEMDPATGTLTAVPSYFSGTGVDINSYTTPVTTEVNFKNTYEAKGLLNISTVKNLTGEQRELTPGMFDFTLTEKATGFEHNGTNDQNGIVRFDTLTFADNGGFENNEKYNVYVMKETPGVLPGIAYDKSEYEITVKLTDNSGNITGEVVKITQVKNAKGEELQQPVVIYDVNADAAANAFTPIVDGTNALIAVGAMNGTTAVGAAFTNIASIHTGTSITIPVTKVLTGRDMIAGEFSFTLTHVGTSVKDTPESVTPTVVDTIRSNAAGDDVADNALAFTRTYGTNIKPGTVITYELAEAIGSKGGITYDKTVYEIQVTVTDSGNDGALEAAITSAKKIIADSEETIDVTTAGLRFPFKNIYKVASTTLTLNGTKTLVGRDVSNGEFVFEVYDTKGTEDTADDVVVTTGTVPAGKVNTPINVAFDPITYYEAGTHTYRVVERAGSRQGVSYSKAEYTVKVNVTENTEDGTLSATVDSITQTKDDKGTVVTVANAAIAFRNVYTPKDLNLAPYLEISKVLTGRTMNADEFDFVVELVSGPVGTPGDIVSYGTNDADGKVTFASFTVNTAGTYVYRITESTTAAPGVTTDGRAIIVTITVADDSNSNLSVTNVAYAEQDSQGNAETDATTDAQTFYNKYEHQNVTTGFDVSKKLNGKDFVDETFTFAISLTRDGSAVEPPLKELTVDKTGVKSYPTYTYTQPGKYVWTITEVKGSDKVGNGMMTYDAAKYTITEEVLDNTAAGKLEIVSSVIEKYDNANDTTGETAVAVIFTNTYTPNPITQNLDVVMDAPQDKTLTGRDMVDGEFTFTVKDLQGNEVATGTNDAAGNIILTYKNVPAGLEAGIPFTSAGTYYFTVSEVVGTASSVAYDPAVWTVRIDVTYDPASGKLIASDPVITDVKERAVVAAEDITFVNVYDPVDATIELKGSKVLNLDHSATNRAMHPGEFEFHLLNSTGGVVRKAFNDAEGNIVFEKLTFSAATAQPLNYTIVELNKGATGVTYSDAIYTVTINVVDDTDAGKLVATTKVTDASGKDVTDSWTYENSYKGLPAAATINATKNLVGKDLTEGEFRFELKPVGKPAGAADVVITGGTNAADGSITFRVENLTENGRYTFEMTEAAGPDDNVIYSTQTYTVYVDVTDSGSGYKSAEVIYKSGTAPTFTNTYNPDPVIVTIDADKVMTGNRTTVKDNEFKFEVRNEANDVVATGVTKADGSIDFDYGTGKTGIEIGTAGTFAYTVTEVEPDKSSADHVAGVKYDKAVWTLTVTTEYNEATGVLSNVSEVITVTGSDADPADGIVFINEYDPIDAKVILKGEKTLSGRALTDEEFTFRLLDADQNVVREVKNGQYGEIDEIIFPALVYTKPTAAPEVYTIVEVDEGDTGVTYSGVVYTVTIEVKDNAAIGELVPTVTITDANGDPVTDWSFANSYKGLPVSATVNAIKKLEGKPLTAGEFAFRLVEKAGNPVQATPVVITGGTNAADGSIIFNVENLTEEGVYAFVMTEVAGGDDNITYSDRSVDVFITVEDLKDGSMKAEVTYQTGTAPVFTNVYTPDPAVVTIKADKNLTGRDLKAGEFRFVIRNEAGDKLADGTNDAEGNILFTQFKLGMGNGQKLYVSEVEGDEKNVTYDSTVYILSVDMVNKDNAGVLVPVVHYPVDGVVFDNEYVEPEVPTPPAPLSPDTGDHTPVTLWIMLMAFSLCGMAILGKKRRGYHN